MIWINAYGFIVIVLTTKPVQFGIRMKKVTGRRITKALVTFHTYGAQSNESGLFKVALRQETGFQPRYCKSDGIMGKR
ncbi:hypothetical protein [Mediterraneibacter agrestimuris]|uniref:hypothetical protein n=1 Tax=Mediterraneibacter agrestimuris TaxID=2941333 RepID=UPI00203FC2EA|nr:hypothetical protein [Mediterraneibacter agrestimuris]